MDTKRTVIETAKRRVRSSIRSVVAAALFAALAGISMPARAADGLASIWSEPPHRTLRRARSSAEGIAVVQGKPISVAAKSIAAGLAPENIGEIADRSTLVALRDVPIAATAKEIRWEGPPMTVRYCGLTGSSFDERFAECLRWAHYSAASYYCRLSMKEPSPQTRFIPEGTKLVVADRRVRENYVEILFEASLPLGELHCSNDRRTGRPLNFAKLKDLLSDDFELRPAPPVPLGQAR